MKNTFEEIRTGIGSSPLGRFSAAAALALALAGPPGSAQAQNPGASEKNTVERNDSIARDHYTEAFKTDTFTTRETLEGNYARMMGKKWDEVLPRHAHQVHPNIILNDTVIAKHRATLSDDEREDYDEAVKNFMTDTLDAMTLWFTLLTREVSQVDEDEIIRRFNLLIEGDPDKIDETRIQHRKNVQKRVLAAFHQGRGKIIKIILEEEKRKQEEEKRKQEEEKRKQEELKRIQEGLNELTEWIEEMGKTMNSMPPQN